MTDAPIAAPAPEPEAVALPTPISVEPRTVAPAEAAEIARQAEEAKLPRPVEAKKAEAKVEEPKSEKKLSTREALRAAREKVEAEPASPLKADPKVVEPVAAKDAKAEPAKDAQPRAEDGKFTAKVAEPASKADAQVVKVDEAAGKAASVEVKAPVASAVKEPAKPSFTAEPPPSRFSKAAQERWAEAPEEVRSEVTRAVTELTKGFEKHREAAESFNDYKELHDIAKTHGHKSGAEVFRAYYEMENALRNPETRDKAFEGLFQKLGTTSRAFAEKVLGHAPDAAASQADATIAELRNEIAELKKGFGEIHAERTQAKTATVKSTVEQFAADPAHSRFDELAEDIAFFLKTKHPGDLAKAYEAAERLNPASVAEKPEPKVEPKVEPASTAAIVPLVTAPASTAPAKSIAGAPTAGSDPSRKQPSSSIKEALKRARAAAG